MAFSPPTPALPRERPETSVASLSRLNVRGDLPESPRWDARLARLYWVDISQGRLHRCDETGADHQSWDIGAPLGHCNLTEDPERILLAVGTRIILFSLTSGAREVMAAVEESPDLRINDGAIDPLGDLWFGTTRLDYRAQGGALYRYRSDLGLSKEIDRVSIANGLAWGDGAMYFVDSTLRRIDRFQWNAANGAISRNEICLRTHPHMPDGIAMDACGDLWVALFGPGELLQIEAQTGTLRDTIPCPVSLPTSCCIGGCAGRTLFVTTAKDHHPMPPSRDPELSGRILHFDLGSQRMPPPRYWKIP